MTVDPTISVVIPTFQRRDRLPVVISALAAQDLDEPFEVIVVDDGSTDGTWDRLGGLAGQHDWLRTLRSPENQGSAAARNLGWEIARAPLIAFTDDDCAPAPGWLRSLLDGFESGADLVSGPTMPDPEGLAHAGPFSHWVKVEGPTHWFPTCNIGYRRCLLASLGGFDERFAARTGACHGEDTDLAWRAIESGATVRFEPDALVHHEVTASDWFAWVKSAERSRGIPEVVSRHAGLRRSLPNRFVYLSWHPPALLTTVGAVATLLRPHSPVGWAIAVGAGAEYVRLRTRGPGRRIVPAVTPRTLAGMFVADLLEAVVVTAGALKRRMLLV